jgi:hypothetical protein
MISCRHTPYLYIQLCTSKAEHGKNEASIRSPRSARRRDQLFEGEGRFETAGLSGSELAVWACVLRSDAHLLALRNVYSICQCLKLNLSCMYNT